MQPCHDLMCIMAAKTVHIPLHRVFARYQITWPIKSDAPYRGRRVMIVTLDLPPNQTRALTEMARRWRFEDAEHILRGSRGITADSLCERVTSLLQALAAAGTGSTTTDEAGDRSLSHSKSNALITPLSVGFSKTC
jgi:hypothetical protein